MTTEDRPVYGASGRKIVYDKDGKPCRACNTLVDFQMLGKKPGAKSDEKTPEKSQKTDPKAAFRSDPPDVELLGRSSWTLLHSIAARYPEQPTSKEQADMKSFVTLFGQFYPCWFCADDFRKYVSENEVDTGSSDRLGQWMCGAHNDVNRKLGKAEFDCMLWKKRWRDGWES